MRVDEKQEARLRILENRVEKLEKTNVDIMGEIGTVEHKIMEIY